MSKHRKTELKELAEKGTLPAATFRSHREGGPDHEPGWVAEVELPDGTAASGVGRTRSAAEDNAAAALLQKVPRSEAE